MSIKEKLIITLSKLTLGPSVTESMRVGYGNLSFQKYLKAFSRVRKINAEMNKSLDHFLNAQLFYLDAFIPQGTPLILVSGLIPFNRSYLFQHFDGHSKIDTLPFELNLNQKDNKSWPHLDLEDPPESWIDVLFDPTLTTAASKSVPTSSGATKRYPFVFSAYLLKALFLRYFYSRKANNEREIFDVFFTSLNIAWLNNQNFSTKKSFIMASLQFDITQKYITDFLGVYPDGRLIVMLCDPTEWLSYNLSMTTKISLENQKNILTFLNEWENYAATILNLKNEFSEVVCVIGQNDFRENSDKTIRYLTDLLKIDFDEILLSPTYNKIPIDDETNKFNRPKSFFEDNDNCSFALSDSDWMRIKTLKEQFYDTLLYHS